jgi:hypothetical protein
MASVTSGGRRRKQSARHVRRGGTGHTPAEPIHRARGRRRRGKAKDKRPVRGAEGPVRGAEGPVHGAEGPVRLWPGPGELQRRTREKLRVLGQLDAGAVDEICRGLGHRWREVKLTPGKTVGHFAWQMLMGNETCHAVRHHGGCAFSAEAYCMARRRLPLGALEQLGVAVAAEALSLAGAAAKGEHRWKGSSVYRIDGSSTSLPDVDEVRRHFGLSNKQKRGCGYPTAHLLVLTGPAGVAVDLICSPLRTGDMTHAAEVTDGAKGRHLRPGDILTGDGQFSGWGHLYHLQTQGLHGLFPAHHSRKGGWGPGGDGPGRRFVKSLGYYDQLVEYAKPDRRPKWMGKKQWAAAPRHITVREARRSVWVGGVRRMITVVTTLLDPQKYPAKELVKLLGERWLIEVDLRSLKTTMGMESLKCKTVEGVRKELAMYLIVYNLVRMRMLRAAERQGVPLARISFADALASLRYGGDPEAELEVNPDRPGRSEPRVVKRRPKAYPKMTRTRRRLRRELKAKRRAAFA